jgi:uncharacterized Fe-S cluster-containing radical SAM superfamily enzyme
LLLTYLARPSAHAFGTLARGSQELIVVGPTERKILRKIYGSVKESELWRIRRNDELEDIIKGENIVRFIKSQRI